MLYYLMKLQLHTAVNVSRQHLRTCVLAHLRSCVRDCVRACVRAFVRVGVFPKIE